MSTEVSQAEGKKSGSCQRITLDIIITRYY